MRILIFDPGESTGWIFVEKTDDKYEIIGGTIKHDRSGLWQLLRFGNPDLIIFETFRLYKSHAQSMINNTFYTCEIIGILKLYVDIYGGEIEEFPAANKKYSGAKTTDDEWRKIKAEEPSVTEHTFDAYMHWKWYERNRLKK